ncbi:MAG: hypothetical protein KDD36_14920 [Flavobacteriales bacterium]|nr:hypothetical protein [Flavobacteriales bacterium]
MKAHILSSLLCFLAVDNIPDKIPYSPYQPELAMNIRHDSVLCQTSSECQRLAWELSFLGRFDDAENVWERTCIKTVRESVLPAFTNGGYKPTVAHNYIVSQATSNRVVMINEAHHDPKHRVFTSGLLEQLYEQGFRYLGCEGLQTNDQEALRKRGYPVFTSSGFYLKESQYGNLIRKAISLGFHVFGYDQISNENSGIESREELQARNIWNVIQQDSTAKVLIHAGWGHIREDSAGIPMMARWFKQLSGIDPLTIDQTVMNDRFAPDCTDPVYKQVAPDLTEPSVFINDEMDIYRRTGVDIMVFHPPTVYWDGRPSWLYDNPGFHALPLELPDSLHFPLLIRVYSAAELDNPYAVPVDVYTLLEPQESTDMFVPGKGEFVIVFTHGKEVLKLEHRRVQ